MITTPRIFACLATLLLSGPVLAQTEEDLKNAFMGRQVVARIDLPATYKGVDLRFDRATPFDLKEHTERLSWADIGIRQGESAKVTFIKVKGDLIEFHLGGGGFENPTTRTVPYEGKSSAESDLEKEIKKETDSARKRRLQDELNDLERDRQRRQDRARREVEEWNRDAVVRDRERALRSGSRINLRFKKRVPPEALTAAGFEQYLDPWVDFSGRSSRRPAPAASTSSSTTSSQNRDWRKGTPRREMEQALGKARRERSCPGDDTGLDCRIATFEDGDEEIEATFVEGVLVRFSSRRR